MVRKNLFIKAEKINKDNLEIENLVENFDFLVHCNVYLIIYLVVPREVGRGHHFMGYRD